MNVRKLCLTIFTISAIFIASFTLGSNSRCFPQPAEPSEPVTQILSPSFAPDRLIGRLPEGLLSIATLIAKGLSTPQLVISPPTSAQLYFAPALTMPE